MGGTTGGMAVPVAPWTISYRVAAQGRVSVRAIEALGTIEASGPFERALA